MDLESLEGTIRSIARRFARDPATLDDYIQIGRIAAWKIGEKYPDVNKSLYIKAIQNAIIDQLRADTSHRTTHVRSAKRNTISLDGREGDPPEEVIGHNTDFTLEEELAQTLLESLKKKYGFFYVESIQNEEPHPKYRANKIVRAVIEHVAKIPQSEVPKKVDQRFFKEHGLSRFLWVFYNNSAFLAVNSAYKGVYLPWDFKRKPRDFWRGPNGYQHAVAAVDWYCMKQDINTKEDCAGNTNKDFESVGLGSMIDLIFHSSPYLALKAKFSDLERWYDRTPKGIIKELSYQRQMLSAFLLANQRPLLDNLNSEETYDLGLRTFVTRESLVRSHMGGIIDRHSGSTHKMFKTLYPDQILPWTLMTFQPKEENRADLDNMAIHWLFHTYLNIPLEEIPQYATTDFFRQFGFGGAFKRAGCSPFKLVDNAYPGVFTEKEFSRRRDIRYLESKDLQRHRKRGNA